MIKKDTFPLIKRDTVATRRGNFYMLRGDKWFKAEFYLPASPTTYGYESMIDLAENFLDRLESGEKPFKHALTDNGNVSASDMTSYINKWFHSPA